MKCYLYDKNNLKENLYEGAIYTKLNGVYGYLCVSVLDVKFFWADSEGEIFCDHMNDYFEVKYIID